jgi:Fe-S oxidoreductase
MAVIPDRAVFWFGCNMTRHAEMIRISAALLDLLGVEAAPAGGPGYCCGAPKEGDARVAQAMGQRTAAKFEASGHEAVVTWCPSCHMNVQDMVAPVRKPRFTTVHLTELVHARRDRLRPHLRHAVPRRVLLHRHHGFQRRAPVNEYVAEILAMIPSLELVTDGPVFGGHMCSALGPVPGALPDMHRATLDAARAEAADTVGTIFHSCHRELVTLARHGLEVANWTHLLAMSLGWDAADGYAALRNSPDPRALIDDAAMAEVGALAYDRLVEPELRKAPPV